MLRQSFAAHRDEVSVTPATKVKNHYFRQVPNSDAVFLCLRKQSLRCATACTTWGHGHYAAHRLPLSCSYTKGLVCTHDIAVCVLVPGVIDTVHNASVETLVSTAARVWRCGMCTSSLVLVPEREVVELEVRVAGAPIR